MIHPSIVVGLVSGTGAGLVETFVRSTAVDCGALAACFVSNVSAVCAPRFDSCALLGAVRIVLADASRSDLAAAGRSSADRVDRFDGERRCQC